MRNAFDGLRFELAPALAVDDDEDDDRPANAGLLCTAPILWLFASLIQQYCHNDRRRCRRLLEWLVVRDALVERRIRIVNKMTAAVTTSNTTMIMSEVPYWNLCFVFDMTQIW